MEQLPVKIKGAVMFPKSYGVFVYFCFLILVCVFLKKKPVDMEFQPILAIVFCFFGTKSRVSNWATVGSITGPHVGPFFLRHMWPSY